MAFSAKATSGVNFHSKCLFEPLSPNFIMIKSKMCKRQVSLLKVDFAKAHSHWGHVLSGGRSEAEQILAMR